MSSPESLLREVKLFALLDEEHRAALAELVDRRGIAAGQVLFRAGDPGESLYVVATGEVELYLEDTEGQRIVLALAGPGDLFGELALLDEGSRTATAVSRTESELLEVGRDDLLRLVQQQPEAAMALLAAMAAMTRRSNEALRVGRVANVNEVVEERLTPLQRVADWIA